jgi:hypothetical protein
VTAYGEDTAAELTGGWSGELHLYIESMSSGAVDFFLAAFSEHLTGS